MLKLLKRVEDFDFLLRNNSKKVLVKFFATWCQPCQRLQENIKRLLENETECLVLEVDVEKFSELAYEPEFNVRSVPTLFLFFQGKKIRENRGYLSIDELQKFIKI
jgi:thioredoxin-like negative regulator of GroEL